MNSSKIERLCNSIASLHPVMKEMCCNGHCYDFALILYSQFPEGEIWYSYSEGHVYFKYKKYWYDIKGKHLRRPKDSEKLDHSIGHKPHRWSKGAGWKIYR